LQVDNIPHREEDTIYWNGLLFEVQYCPDIVQDLLSEYSTKERLTLPTLFVLKVPFEVPHDCGTALFIVGMYF
jgi:hypothetical protein